MTVQGEKDSSAAGAAPIERRQATPPATWQWMGDSLVTANGLFVIHASASAECGRVNECGNEKATVHFTCTHRRLIAAAPDLKAQLAIAVRWLAGMHSDAGGDEITELREVHPDAWKCIDAMRAALAKAGV